ncbi:hypothetical protein WA026_017635 [Henosepilachna vigintioctopunctata]|uniref:Uncharacterized protein n=1 Tax=Henosepilachna vigintioctopunctata TaxID=420089 RepID=A0AAW1V0Q7_9CUCU
MSSDKKDDEVFGISDNSNSSDNDSKNDEEYSPDKLMRGTSMNRPLRLSNDPGPGVPGTSGSAPALEENNQRTVELRTVLKGLECIKNTIDFVIVPSFRNEHPSAFLNTLDILRFKLDEINIKVGGLDAIPSEHSAPPSGTADTFEPTVLDIHIQIANFYAYIVVEYLKLLNKAKRSEETKNFVTNILDKFEKLGTRDEIAKKIHLRSSEFNNESNYCQLVPLSTTNDAILKQLKKSLKKKKKKKSKLCSVKRLCDYTFYENHFHASNVVFLINTVDIPARESIEEKPPIKNKETKKAKKAKKKSKSAKKVAEKSELTSDMGSQQSTSNEPDSVSSEAESVPKPSSNETESVLKPASTETESVSKSASNETESVSKSASNETESVSKSASNETKSVSDETESVSKSASNETESVSNETESVSKSASNETESVSKSASNETESVSKSASNETESISKSAWNETKSVSMKRNQL